MLDQAERSKIELSEEIRALQGWLADYEKYSDQFNSGALLQNLSLDRLKDILKAMYVSPINYDEMYFKMKDRIDTVDMIRIKLKQVMEEHEQLRQSILATNNGLSEEEKKIRTRLRYGKVSYELKLFKKKGKI